MGSWFSALKAGQGWRGSAQGRDTHRSGARRRSGCARPAAAGLELAGRAGTPRRIAARSRPLQPGQPASARRRPQSRRGYIELRTKTRPSIRVLEILSPHSFKVSTDAETSASKTRRTVLSGADIIRASICDDLTEPDVAVGGLTKSVQIGDPKQLGESTAMELPKQYDPQ